MKIILCLPVEGNPSVGINGSTKQDCQKCGVPVWVAPSTFKVYDIKEDLIACLDCVQKLSTEQNLGRVGMTGEQIEELKEHGVI